MRSTVYFHSIRNCVSGKARRLSGSCICYIRATEMRNPLILLVEEGGIEPARHGSMRFQEIRRYR